MSTRLPVIPNPGVDVVVEDGFIGWTIVHWDADPDVDDQIYAARLFKTPESHRPLVVSRTRNPWETVDVLGEYFQDDVEVTTDVEDVPWIVTDVEGEPDVAPIDGGNPPLTHPEGQRDRIRNDAWREHPLEFRDGDGNPLLSQGPGTEGKFEDDDFVDWQAKGKRVEFTLTKELVGSLDHSVSTDDPENLGGAVASQFPPPIYVEVQRLKADEAHHFDVWASFGGVFIPTPWATGPRTLGIPAVSRKDELMVVGAVQAIDLGLGEGETRLAFERRAEDLKGHSSQGPTQDGRRGLDIAAPSHVSTNARGPVEEVFGFQRYLGRRTSRHRRHRAAVRT